MQTENVINSLNKSLTSESNDDTINEFIARIQTYIDGQKWIKKPIVLSPAICSQYGWKCVKSDLLECVTCSAKLSAHQPSITNFLAYKACIGKMLSDLRDSHGKHCPWPLTPSPENFVKMTLMPKEEALSQFLKRIKACLPFKSSFPRIKDSITDELSFSEHQINSLCKMAGIRNEEANHFGKSVVSLAVTGWIITEGSETGKSAFKCNSCQRSVSCDAFSLLEPYDSSNKENGAQPDTAEAIQKIDIPTKSEDCDKESLGEPPAKRKRVSFVIKKGEPFDPLHEHRPWCLWIFSGTEDYASTPKEITATNNSQDNIPGWNIFMKSLLRNISDSQSIERNSPSKEQIRNVRNLLEKWT